MTFRRFDQGAAVIGAGWFARLGRLRLIWAPLPDRQITKVILDDEEPSAVRLTVDWTDPE